MRMGNDFDTSSVVDPFLRVRGASNLRVAGATWTNQTLYDKLLEFHTFLPFHVHYYSSYFLCILLDASIIPYITNGNVHTTVLMIASKLVKMIIPWRILNVP